MIILFYYYNILILILKVIVVMAYINTAEKESVFRARAKMITKTIFFFFGITDG